MISLLLATTIYLCQSPSYSLVVGRSRDCPGIERKVRRALRVSLIANYRDGGLSAAQARRETARALPTYVCGWAEVRGCTSISCQGGSSSSNGGILE